MPKKAPAEVRLWAKTDRSGGPDACWLWLGAKTRDGYGRMAVGGTKNGWYYVHRFSYELAIGPIPDGMVMDHLCRTRNCVNPKHLEPVTNRENLRRGIRGVLTTHCPKGHPYTDESTYWSPATAKRGTSRRCRICARSIHVRMRDAGYHKTPEYLARKRLQRRARGGAVEV